MSSLIKIKKNKFKFMKQIGKSKEIAMSFFALLVFLVVSVVIIKDINPAKEDVPNYFELSKNPYVKYEKFLNRTDLRKIMDSRQFLEMRYNEDIVKKENPLEKEDPFAGRFGDEYDSKDENNNNDEKNEDMDGKEDSEENDDEEGDNEETNNED